MNFLANPIFAWIRKKTLGKMQSADPRGSFYVSENIMGLGILTHRRDCLDDLTKNSRDLQSDSGFKRCSGCFIRFPNSRVRLPVFTLPPPLLLRRGSFEEGVRDPARPLIIIHNGPVVYPETLCTFLELGPVCRITHLLSHFP